MALLHYWTCPPSSDNMKPPFRNPTSDSVYSPPHYDLFPGQQAIDVIRAALTREEYAGYLKGNVLKYRLRAGRKGDAAEDLGKAEWYREALNAIDR